MSVLSELLAAPFEKGSSDLFCTAKDLFTCASAHPDSQVDMEWAFAQRHAKETLHVI